MQDLMELPPTRRASVGNHSHSLLNRPSRPYSTAHCHGACGMSQQINTHTCKEVNTEDSIPIQSRSTSRRECECAYRKFLL